MKRILCYGDSNTRGSIGNGQRMDDVKQWPNILQRLLGDQYWIVQEGLGGRVAGELDERPYINSHTSFEVAYRSAWPVDLVIIALGTNDLKAKYHRSALDIADNLLWYQQEITRLEADAERTVHVLYVYPENHPQAEIGVWAELIKLMDQFDAPVINLGNVAKGPDGLHFSEAGHETVARKLKDKAEEMLA
jgi:lysophospholipase L1-like esterase